MASKPVFTIETRYTNDGIIVGNIHVGNALVFQHRMNAGGYWWEGRPYLERAMDEEEARQLTLNKFGERLADLLNAN